MIRNWWRRRQADKERCSVCGSADIFSRSAQGAHCFVHPPTEGQRDD